RPSLSSLPTPPPPPSPLFPYTTLFRSRGTDIHAERVCRSRLDGERGEQPQVATQLEHPAPGPGSRLPEQSPAQVPRPFAGEVKRSEEHTSELQSLAYLVCRLLLEKKKK